MTSIRQRLLLTLLLIIALVGAVTLARSYLDARHEVQELFDAQLAQSARVLQSLVYHELLEGEPIAMQELLKQSRDLARFQREQNAVESHGHNYEVKVGFQVWDRGGRLLLHSVSTPDTPLVTSDLHDLRNGFSDAVIGNVKWRVFSLWDKDQRYVVQVGERYSVRDELTTKISRRLVMPSLISIPILGLMIWLGVGRGLAPLRRVALEVRRRAPAHLDPMEIGPVPREIRPLVEALNALFVRLQQAFEKERRFTGDAAHELRTPLSALRTQAQVALRASDEEQRRTALLQVIEGVDRATHLLQQLLTLARLEPGAASLELLPVNLHEATAQVVSDLATQALDKHIDIELIGDEEVPIAADAGTLSMLLRNLIDNAVRYTPPGGRISISTRRVAQGAWLEVADTGPGIAPELRARVFDRFYRVLGSDMPGCGLGLAIVKQVADLHGATVELLDNPHGGLLVQVRFPGYQG